MEGRNGNCGGRWRAETSLSLVLVRSMRAGRTTLAPAADLSDGLFRLFVEPAQARAAPRRGTRRETVDPSRLRPACHGEAESRKGATASGRSRSRPASLRREPDAGGSTVSYTHLTLPTIYSV